MKSVLTTPLLVDSAKIELYARLTDDYNPIHLNAEFAARTQMGGIIAHGTMSMNLVWQAISLLVDLSDCDLISLDIRFVRPVREGAVVVGGASSCPEADRMTVWVRDEAGLDVITGTVLTRAKAASLGKKLA